jgi:hypothetical protein
MSFKRNLISLELTKMNEQNLRTIVNNFFNNYSDDLQHFANNNNYINNQMRSTCYLIVRALMDDMNIIHDRNELATTIINRMNQLNIEMQRFNQVMENIIDNRWTNLSEHIQLFIRAMRGAIGLFMLNFAQINVPYEQYDNILNQLGVGVLLNENNNNNYNHN